MLRFTKRSGTPVYMAPEIYSRNYSYEADVWSLGIMLYQLVTHRFPFWDTFDHCQVLKIEEVRGAGGSRHGAHACWHAKQHLAYINVHMAPPLPQPLLTVFPCAGALRRWPPRCCTSPSPSRAPSGPM